MRTLLTWPIVLTSLALAGPSVAEDDYYEDDGRGWFWYEEKPVVIDPPEEPPVEVLAPQPVTKAPEEPIESAAPAGPVPGSVAWLRDAMPKALDLATDNPTYENIERYMLLQKAAMDKSEKFAEVAQLVTTGHPALDEGRRRPRGDTFAKDRDEEASEAQRQVLTDLFKENALIMFLDRACSGCSLLANNLTRMSQTHGLVWRVVSMDGSILGPEFEASVVFDNGLSDELGVDHAGALFIATPPDRFEPVTWTPTAGIEIVERILMVAYRAGLISEEEYRSTVAVDASLYALETTPTQEVPEILQQADSLLLTQGISLESK